MKLKKQKYKLIKIKNINNSYLDRYNIKYSFLCFKFTIKNKKKIEFYKNQRKEKILDKYNKKYKKIIDKLNEKRKNKNPILTIILLTYNHLNTIEKCIKSLLNQKTKYKYVIKIFDDASFDGTTDICFKYAKKYYEKINFVLEPFNTKAGNFTKAIKDIDTKYWCFIDGDDWWLTNDKIETAIDFLEKNDEYTIYANDYIRHSHNEDYSLVHSWYKLPQVNQDISFENFAYIHPSARFHRNCINWKKEYKNIIKADYPLFILSLVNGKCFFENKVKSIWNFNKKGMYSNRSTELQNYGNLLLDYKLNIMLNFKYDKFFTSKNINIKNLELNKNLFGKKLGWALTCYFYKVFSLKQEKRVLKEKYKKEYKENLNKYKKLEERYTLRKN